MASSENRNDSQHSGGSPTSLTLLEQACQNKQEAWQRVVELYSPLVFDLCRRGLPPGAIGDVYQDVFTSVLASLHSFHRERNGSFRCWLETITKHKIIDYYRGLKREPAGTGGSTAHERLQQFAEPVDGPPPSADGAPQTEEEILQKSLLRSALKSVLARFDVKSWQAVLLTVAEGLAATEAAAKLEMTHGAVRNAKSRLLLALREELQARVEELADLDDFGVEHVLRLLREVLAEYRVEPQRA